jgi:hypothetical protein
VVNGSRSARHRSLSPKTGHLEGWTLRLKADILLT